MASEPTRVVFDCNVFVQGLASRNSAARIALHLFFNGQITLFISNPILEEVKEVLARPELRRILPGITNQSVNAFLTKLAEKAVTIANVPEEYHYERDPDDEMYINLAIVTNSIYLVSNDNDLRDLMTKENNVSREFRRRYPLLRIMDAGHFINEIAEITG